MQRAVHKVRRLWQEAQGRLIPGQDFQALEEVLCEIFAPVAPRGAFRRGLRQRLLQAAASVPHRGETRVAEVLRPALIAGAALGVATVAAFFVWRRHSSYHHGTS